MNAALYLSFVVTSLVVLVLPGPSFAYARGHLSLQLLVLGATFVPLQVAWDVGRMFGVLRLRAHLTRLMDARRQRWANRASGTAFVALGMALLLQERPR